MPDSLSTHSERVLEARKVQVWPDAKPGDPEYGQTYEDGPRDEFALVRCPVCGDLEQNAGVLPSCAHDHPEVTMELVQVRVVEVLRRAT